MAFSDGQQVVAADLNALSVTTVVTTGDITAGDDLIATDDVNAGDDITAGGDITAVGAVAGGTVVSAAGLYERGRTPAVGDWTSVAFSAGNFTAQAGTWTVDAGDQVTLAYTLIGKMMTVAFSINGTDVSTTPTYLAITIPASATAAKGMINACSVVDAGSAAVGFCLVDASGTTIKIIKLAIAAFTATSSDNTTVQGQITFEVA